MSSQGQTCPFRSRWARPAGRNPSGYPAGGGAIPGSAAGNSIPGLTLGVPVNESRSGSRCARDRCAEADADPETEVEAGVEADDGDGVGAGEQDRIREEDDAVVDGRSLGAPGAP